MRHILELELNKIVLILSIFFLSIGCKKGSIPILTTVDVTNITPATASSRGNISSDGGTAVISHGHCWSTTPNPTTADSKTSIGQGTSQYESFLIFSFLMKGFDQLHYGKCRLLLMDPFYGVLADIKLWQIYTLI